MRSRLAALLKREGDAGARPLSVRWQPAVGRASALGSWLPLWVGTFIVAGLLAALYFSLALSLASKSDRVFAQIAALRLPAPAASAAKPGPAPQPRLLPLLDAAAGQGLQVRDEIDRSIITLRDDALFEAASAGLLRAGADTLRPVAQALRGTAGQVLVLGHTDSHPERSARFPSNWELSVERARAVHDALLLFGVARIALIAAFALQYLVHKGWSAWSARRRNERVVDQLAPAASGAEPAELAQLRKRFSAALATLRRTRFGSRGGYWSSLSWKFGRQYLYQLPWYLIIGAPGAGKTTALLNSGLKFPLAGEFGRGSIKGVGGTRNCDWWFTDRAVLLDTAGRYTTHEADRVADRRAWEGFLALLKRGRPRQPLNGALVAVSVTDQRVFDRKRRDHHAATLRTRLDEIRAAIGIRLPVYLLLTKCDLLPGFLGSFLAFEKRTRDQVWGRTFDFDASNKGRAADQFPAAFEQLVERLHENLIERMQGERDPQRRARIFAFPRQFVSLREPLDDLVRRVFGVGTSSAADGAPCLRGVYFTSGTQEGTPIDRTLSALGRELGLERQILPPNQSTGKSFFLAGLLRDVVFPEAEIAGRSPRLERWRARAITALLVAMQCAGALLAAYWATSYTRSSGEAEQIAGNVAATRTQIEASDVRPGSDPRPLLPALNAMQDLIVSTSPAAGEPGAPMAAFRRHQRVKLAAAAHQAYERMLLDSLLVRIIARCEEQMRSGVDPNLQYEALKAYTMLHEAAHFDAASLKAFVTYDWDSGLEPPLAREDRAQLVQHLDALP